MYEDDGVTNAYLDFSNSSSPNFGQGMLRTVLRQSFDPQRRVLSILIGAGNGTYSGAVRQREVRLEIMVDETVCAGFRAAQAVIGGGSPIPIQQGAGSSPNWWQRIKTNAFVVHLQATSVYSDKLFSLPCA